MKILILCPSFYTLHSTISAGFKNLGYEVYHHDYRTFLKIWQQQVNTQIFRLPLGYREKWESYFFPLINKQHIEVFDQIRPDIVFIYNNEMLLPETLKYFKSQNAKIMFILGDSPYYTPTNKYYMSLLFLADLIISPDSFWMEQLKLLGLKNIILEFPGFDESLLNFREPTQEEKTQFSCDALFVGTGYVDAWGYKRALFASRFAELDLKVYGNKHWLRWLEFFPELKPKFELLKQRISLEQLIIMNKCARVYPVDANPAILHGVHLRIFDCIAMGVLPLAEYRKDQDIFFNGANLPIIKSYDEASAIAKKYIENDRLREETLKDLLAFIKTKFRSDLVLKRIMENV